MTSVVVLGMHRTGTSMVASILDALGVNMGDNLVPPGYGNPLGFFEDIEFVKLNDRILKAAGGNWADPPPRHRILLAGDEFRDEIGELIASREAKGVAWGWKDPRAALTAELFLWRITDRAVIRCLRSRRATVASLLARTDADQILAEKLDDNAPFLFTERTANLIADEYENRISALDVPMLPVGYELCRSDPLRSVQRIARYIGLDPHAETVEKAAGVIR